MIETTAISSKTLYPRDEEKFDPSVKLKRVIVNRTNMIQLSCTHSLIRIIFEENGFLEQIRLIKKMK